MRRVALTRPASPPYRRTVNHHRGIRAGLPAGESHRSGQVGDARWTSQRAGAGHAVRRADRAGRRRRPSATAARPRAPPPASPTASSTTGPAPTWSSRPSAPPAGSGSQRLYSFKDILVLKVVKRLLDAGVSLQNIRVAVDALRARGVDDLAQHHPALRRHHGLRVHLLGGGRRPAAGRPGRVRHRGQRRAA